MDRQIFNGAAVSVNSSMSIDEMLIRAGLDWDVVTGPMLYGPNLDLQAPVQAARRADNNVFIDVYDKRNPWQNRQILNVFNDFCTRAGLEIDYIGFIPTDWKLFAAAKLGEFSPPQAVGDITEGYLLLTDSHKCRNGLSGSLWLNRLACTNGMRRGIQQENRKIISHIGKFNDHKVTQVLDAVWNTFDQEKQQVATLANVEMTYREAQLLLIKEFGDASKAWDEQPKIVQTVLQLFDGKAQGSDSLAFYNTAYGLLQSVIEHQNYYGYQRGTNVDRFASVLSGGYSRSIDKFNASLNVFVNNKTNNRQMVSVGAF
jgi:hypothetical protein